MEVILTEGIDDSMEVILMEGMDYSMEELLPLVAELSSRYTGFEHTSITYEKAHMLMEAVLYCIREYQETRGSGLLASRISAKEAYQYGQELVIRKTQQLRCLYNRLILNFEDYGLACLRDTVVTGIPLFLSKYDFTFAPQETIITLDYPVSKDLGKRSGIDLVLEYLECIDREQRFLQRFDTGYVIEQLLAYHPDYECLIENIYDIVLSDMVGT